MDKYGKSKYSEAETEIMDTSDMVEKSEEANQSSESPHDVGDEDSASRSLEDEEEEPPCPSSEQVEYQQEDDACDIEEGYAPNQTPELPLEEEQMETVTQEQRNEHESFDDTLPDVAPPPLEDRLMQMYKERGITTFGEVTEAQELELDVMDNEAHTVVHEPDNTIPQAVAELSLTHMQFVDIHSRDEEPSSSFARKLKENYLHKDSRIISHDEVLTP